MTPREREQVLAVMASAAEHRGLMLPPHIETRLLAKPLTFDKESHTVEAVISVGSPVKRFYGTEILKISAASVDLSRIKTGGVPVLNSHDQFNALNILGRVDSAKIVSNNGKNELRGLLRFAETDEGRKAEGMVARGEITGISAGYRVDEWEIEDKDGRIIDPEVDRIRFDDDLTFTATRWTLLEASLCPIPADQLSTIRVHGGDCAVPTSVFALADIRMRMATRQRMFERTKNMRAALDARARMEARTRMRQREADQQQRGISAVAAARMRMRARAANIGLYYA